MFTRKHLQDINENYYIPFLDLISGIVFILMIILSTTIINIKYTDVKSEESTPITKALDPIDLVKKKLVKSISNYLTEYNISNKILGNYSHIVIYNQQIFHKGTLSLSKNGKNIIKGVSESFNKVLFTKKNKNDYFNKHLDYIKLISISIFSSPKNLEDTAMSKSFVFYGHLVNSHSEFLTFSNRHTQRLIRLQDTRFIAETLLNNLEKNMTDAIILNFDFYYPHNEEILL